MAVTRRCLAKIENNIIIFCLMFGVLNIFGSLVSADTIYLKDKNVMEGVVAEERPDKIILATPDGETAIDEGLIEEIFFDNPEQNFLYLGNRALKTEEFDTALEFYQRALRMNSEFKAAHDAIKKLEEAKYRKNQLQRKNDALMLLKEKIGLCIKCSQDIIEVVSVEPDSPAEKAGIRQGDLIIAIWDAPVISHNDFQIASILIEPNAKTAKITIRRKIKLDTKRQKWHQKFFGIGLDERKGLEKEDKIIEIDGHPIKNMSKGQIKNSFDKDGFIIVTLQRYLMLKI